MARKTIKRTTTSTTTSTAKKTAKKTTKSTTKKTTKGTTRGTTRVGNKKALLQKERENLAQKIEKLRENVKVELEFDADEGDPELPERERNLSLIATFEERLKEIDQALEQIDLGNYGTCLQCGKKIPKERLAIFPEARHCVPCKAKLERRNRWYPRSVWKG
ncbi:MAG: TraR/DksA family transcriptional regulator [Ardenticatenaceae bacterium]